MINENVLNQVIEAAKGKDPLCKKITLYSRPAQIILRYLDLTIPQYSRSGAAAELLSEAIKEEYSDLWGRICSAGVPNTVSLSKSYWHKRFPKIDEKIWGQAVEETKPRVGRIITIFHPRVAAVMRYYTQTTPRYNLSKESATILERALSKKYADVWKKALEAIKTDRKQ